MCGLLIRPAGVGNFSPGFCLGMDVAFCVGHWHVINKVWWWISHLFFSGNPPQILEPFMNRECLKIKTLQALMDMG